MVVGILLTLFVRYVIVTASGNMKNKRNSELAVCGLQAVLALAAQEQTAGNNDESNTRITRLYFTAERAQLLKSLCRVLAAQRVPYNQVESDDELHRLCGSVHHQGVVAMIRVPVLCEATDADIADWQEHHERIILLDRISNANNFGAIVRSSAFFGFSRMIVPEADSLLTTSAYRIAEGGMERMMLYTAPSALCFLTRVAGQFVRVGTDAHSGVPAREIGSKLEGKAAVIVLGNEETGISRAVRLQCDCVVTVAGRKNRIDSLNVAQAASIILYECAQIYE
jgi:TrmH RNA methyltransferase